VQKNRSHRKVSLKENPEKIEHMLIFHYQKAEQNNMNIVNRSLEDMACFKC
jgi:hypothetical protein